MNLEELKKKSPAELIIEAEKLEVENPSTLRKQEILFAILKKLAQKNEQIIAKKKFFKFIIYLISPISF